MCLALNAVQVLPPELIPLEGTVHLWKSAKSEQLTSSQMQDAEPITATQLISVLCQSLFLLDAEASPRSASIGRDEDAAHDAYFRIDRVDGDSVAILVQMALRGRLFLAEDVMGPTLPADDASWRVIDQSLIDLLGALVGKTSQVTRSVSASEPGVAPWVPAMTRWVGGHQLFAILTQGLIFSMHSMSRAISTGDAEATGRHADLSISLLRGSAGTFRFTGEFGTDEYTEIIRPSMMPPAVPICLSGLMSVDHRYLVQMLRDMRPALRQLRAQDPLRHRMLATELSEVYDAHIHVCERFVGDKPSIRTAESTERSGPELLQNFRKLRLKPFEHA